MYTRELHARFGHEWDAPGAPSSLPDFGLPLHPSPEWTLGEWAHYVLVPRSWMQLWHLWGAGKGAAGCALMPAPATASCKQSSGRGRGCEGLGGWGDWSVARLVSACACALHLDRSHWSIVEQALEEGGLLG